MFHVKQIALLVGLVKLAEKEKNMYSYYESMRDDIMIYITEYEVDYNDENVKEYLYEALFIEDSVTGNASGSYTFSTYKAREYVLDNIELCVEAMREFECDSLLGVKIFDGEWEYLDVTIRCYILCEVINTVIEELQESEVI